MAGLPALHRLSLATNSSAGPRSFDRLWLDVQPVLVEANQLVWRVDPYKAMLLRGEQGVAHYAALDLKRLQLLEQIIHEKLEELALSIKSQEHGGLLLDPPDGELFPQGTEGPSDERTRLMEDAKLALLDLPKAIRTYRKLRRRGSRAAHDALQSIMESEEGSLRKVRAQAEAALEKAREAGGENGRWVMGLINAKAEIVETQRRQVVQRKRMDGWIADVRATEPEDLKRSPDGTAFDIAGWVSGMEREFTKLQTDTSGLLADVEALLPNASGKRGKVAVARPPTATSSRNSES